MTFHKSVAFRQSGDISASMPMTSTVATPANPGESQVVNASVFDIDYSVEDVGPSGVSAVELFVTEDGGQNWFKYGTDADLKSPSPSTRWAKARSALPFEFVTDLVSRTLRHSQDRLLRSPSLSTHQHLGLSSHSRR